MTTTTYLAASTTEKSHSLDTPFFIHGGSLQFVDNPHYQKSEYVILSNTCPHLISYEQVPVGTTIHPGSRLMVEEEEEEVEVVVCSAANLASYELDLAYFEGA